MGVSRSSGTDGRTGGKVEAGESAEEVAQREIRGATGLDAKLVSPLVVLDQTYVSEEDGEEWFSALFIVYADSAEGEIPDGSQLGVTDGEIQSAQWFDIIPDNLQDGEILRPYL